MIFRAPAGHHLLSKKELNTILEHLESGDSDKAKEYLAFCWEEMQFYDSIRQESEEKKMLEEEGNYAQARMLESEMRLKVKLRVERSKLYKDNFLIQ
jgi:hypothetical protein